MSIDARPEVDTLWYTRCPVPTASGVAIDTGILAAEFKAEDITVASIRASADPAVRESHFDHSQARSFREGGNIPPLHARSRGQRTRLIALTWVEEFQSLLATPGSGINRPEDLRGRRVIVPAHGERRIDFALAMALRGLDGTLALAGLTRDDVEVVKVKTKLGDLVERRGSYHHDHYAAELAALHADEGDVFYVKGAPGRQTAAQHGLSVIADLARSDELTNRINNGTPRTVTVSEELYEERPDLVRRYLSALITAARWASENTDGAFKILAAETGATVTAAVDAYGTQAPTRLMPSFDPRLIKALTFQKDFLLHNGFLDGDIDIAAWIAPEPLPTALESAGIDPSTSPLNGAN